MRLRPRRHRPQTTVTLLVLVFVLSVLIWGTGELLRTRPGCVLVGTLSGLVFLLFLLGWRSQ